LQGPRNRYHRKEKSGKNGDFSEFQYWGYTSRPIKARTELPKNNLSNTNQIRGSTNE